MNFLSELKVSLTNELSPHQRKPICFCVPPFERQNQKSPQGKCPVRGKLQHQSFLRFALVFLTPNVMIGRQTSCPPLLPPPPQHSFDSKRVETKAICTSSVNRKIKVPFYRRFLNVSLSPFSCSHAMHGATHKQGV